MGGNALTQVLQGEQRYDLVLRYLPQYRDTREAMENIRLLSPTGERVSLAQLCKIEERDGASEIYREGNQRYIAIKYSVRGRDLGGAVEEAIRKVNAQVQLPRGYHMDWAGEYESQQRANRRLAVIVPVTILFILILLYTAFESFKWAALILVNLVIAPIGGILALVITGTHFSVSSGVGFLALFGVSVQIGVIMVMYINQLRARGPSIAEATVDGCRPPAPADHDDHAGGNPRLTARCHVPRNWLGFAAALCHRYCGRAHSWSRDEHFSPAHLVCLVGSTYRPPAQP